MVRRRILGSLRWPKRDVSARLASNPPAFASAGTTAGGFKQVLELPEYLVDTYWWAYTTPNAVKVFERQWLVNAILWGNFNRLRDLAIQEIVAPPQPVATNQIRDHALGPHAFAQRGTGTPAVAPAYSPDGAGRSILQIACVYGDFTPRLATALPKAELSVVDIAAVQLDNCSTKCAHLPNVKLSMMNAAALTFPPRSFDTVVLFFLLHEMPDDVRTRTVAEAFRVARPGGRVICVDYHRPQPWSPFRYIMWPVLKLLEPFALAVWRTPLSTWAPAGAYRAVTKTTYFGGLYQKVVFDVPGDAADPPQGPPPSAAV